jgi:FMN phosphatase YigB (HAD superfamily)
MDRAQAYVFDAYDTLFDVHAVVTAVQAVTLEGETVSRQWQLSQAFPPDWTHHEGDWCCVCGIDQRKRGKRRIRWLD